MVNDMNYTIPGHDVRCNYIDGFAIMNDLNTTRSILDQNNLTSTNGLHGPCSDSSSRYLGRDHVCEDDVLGG